MFTSHTFRKKSRLVLGALVSAAATLASGSALAYSQITGPSVSVSSNVPDAVKPYLDFGVNASSSEGRWSTNSFVEAATLQNASVWTKLGGAVHQLSSLTAEGRGRINWVNGNNHTYPQKRAHLKAIVFGNTIWNHSAGCSAAPGPFVPGPGPCTFTSKETFSKSLGNDFIILTVLGVSLTVGGTLTTSAGFDLVAEGNQSSNGQGNALVSGKAKAAPSASQRIAARVTVGADKLLSGGIEGAFEVLKLTSAALTTSTISYTHATKKLNMSFSHQSPINLSAGGGSLKLLGCLAGGCTDWTFLTWPGFNLANWFIYNQTGTLNNVAAF